MESKKAHMTKTEYVMGTNGKLYQRGRQKPNYMGLVGYNKGFGFYHSCDKNILEDFE